MSAFLFNRMFETPLMIHEGKLQAIMLALGMRFVGDEIHFEAPFASIDHNVTTRPQPFAGKIGDSVGKNYDRMGLLPFAVVDNIALIPIEGTLVHKGAYVGKSSGQTSYQGLLSQIARAKSNPAIKGVAFEVDSYGGEVSGAFETSHAISQLSAVKPTMAILTDHAASAGYLMASAARQIIIPQTGSAGSIGVVMMHADMSKKLEKSGVQITLIKAGKHKTDMHPAEPLAPEVKDKLTAQVEGMRQLFAKTVASYRGNRLSYDAVMNTEADMFDGSEAVKAGLADAVGHSLDAFDAFASELNRR